MKPIADTLGQFRQTIKRLFGRQTAHRKRGYQPAIERMEERELLAASFFAPAEPAGSVNVQLDPLANVTAGVQEIVTFGVPFTRGSVSQSQLSQVRVLKNGVEIPAFVEQLTPWRSIDDPAIDGQSVRVARIQIPYTFTSLNPETITVQWGGPARTLNRTTMQDPRLEWHTVTSGSFVAADNVQEPDVLPVLPAAYLAQGMLDARTDPTNSGVAETRDNPAVMDSMTFTGYTEYDSAEKNFFYTIINQNGTTPIDYKTQAEPWLYDRSSGMYELYFRSGFATALREAIRSTDFYVNHLDASGFFTLKPGDPKYSYNESLAYTYWLLGDNRMLAPISTVVNAFDGTATHWTPNLSFWTERNSGDKLLANEIAYEVTGNATFKTNVQTIVGDLIWHQNGAGGQLPSEPDRRRPVPLRRAARYHRGQQRRRAHRLVVDVGPDRRSDGPRLRRLAGQLPDPRLHRPHGQLREGRVQDRRQRPVRRHHALSRLPDAGGRDQRQPLRHRRAARDGRGRGRGLGDLLRRAARHAGRLAPPAGQRPLRDLRRRRQLLDQQQRRLHRRSRRAATPGSTRTAPASRGR